MPFCILYASLSCKLSLWSMGDNYVLHSEQKSTFSHAAPSFHFINSYLYAVLGYNKHIKLVIFFKLKAPSHPGFLGRLL